MLFRIACVVLGFVAAAMPAHALEDCKFEFKIDAQSSAFQALVEGAASRGGFWRPIREAPQDVQDIGRFIGRLDVCLMTPDGKPRTVQTPNGSTTLNSPYVTNCTAALLPGNRLLTNVHCFREPSLVAAGFTRVREARINFGYTSTDFTGNVQTFLVDDREIAADDATDALLLQIIGADANEALGGSVPMMMETDVTPRRALTMVHHPRGDAQQFSSGTCQIHPEQAALPEAASQLRHSCESTGGSSGSLLLDARTLAVMGLHNQGGLNAQGGYNSGHKISAVAAALGLEFQQAGAGGTGSFDPAARAQGALTDALLIEDDAARSDALAQIVQGFPGSRAAQSAQRALDLMQGPGREDPEQTATAALTAALQVQGLSRRSRLEELIATFPETAAAESARAMLELVTASSTQEAINPREPIPGTDVLRVMADGRGDYSSPDAALRAASAGDVIEIYPGLYEGGVDVDIPVTIVGVGDRTTIVWESDEDDVIYWTAGSGRIANLTLHLRGGDFYTVDFDGGSAVLEDNVMSSGGLAIVGVRSGSTATVRNNIIKDGASTGVYVYDDARGTVEDNEILDIKGSGISVKTGGDPVIRRNAIHRSEQSGIYVFEDGKGTIEDNEVTGSGKSAIAVATGSDPIVRRNDVHDNEQSGLNVYDGGRGTFEENEVYANVLSGISVGKDGDPVIRRNTIRDGQQSGIYVYEAAKGLIEDNEIYGNANAGISISEDGDPLIRRNTIRDNGQSGVSLFEGGKGTIEDNEITGNGGAGISAREKSHAVVRGNTITGNAYEAVWIYKEAGGQFEDNDLRGNERGAWDIESSAGSVIRSGNRE